MTLLRALTTVVLGLAVIGTATGCTASSDQSGRPTSKPSDTSAPQAVTQKCIDDFMLVDADQLSPKKATAITQPCGTVSVVGTGGHLSIDSAERIIVEGNANAITAKSVATIVFAGDDNSVTHSGAAPQVDDKGVDNLVTAAD